MLSGAMNESLTHVSKGKKSVLAKNIRYLRMAYDLTQEELSELLPSNPTTVSISMWERGHTEPKHQKITELAHFFHVKEEDLVNTPLYSEH